MQRSLFSAIEDFCYKKTTTKRGSTTIADLCFKLATLVSAVYRNCQNLVDVFHRTQETC